MRVNIFTIATDSIHILAPHLIDDHVVIIGIFSPIHRVSNPWTTLGPSPGLWPNHREGKAKICMVVYYYIDNHYALEIGHPQPIHRVSNPCTTLGPSPERWPNHRERKTKN